MSDNLGGGGFFDSHCISSHQTLKPTSTMYDTPLKHSGHTSAENCLVQKYSVDSLTTRWCRHF